METLLCHCWQLHALNLRYALAELPPQERRQILDYINHTPEPPKAKAYPISECMKASRRVAELLAINPSWSRARARGETARELHLTTVQLRRMLRHVE
ncbi:hypothetical protein [Hymenobacter sp.]|uniref:hypothetical protein n=1 Tax=Hymenobacter sp. TaxID=1898978 RepID=UPI002EDB5584